MQGLVLLLIFFCYSSCAIVKGQVIFPQNPYFEYSGNDFFTTKATITNNFDLKTTFVWERRIVSIPNGWQTSICDLNGCHLPSVATNEVELLPKATDILDCNFYMSLIPNLGTAVVELKVYPMGKPDQFATVTYTGKLVSLLSVANHTSRLLESNFVIGLDQLASKITIVSKSVTAKIENASLSNAMGSITLQLTNLNTDNCEIDHSVVASGIYFLTITDHLGHSFTKKIIL